jgi:hypothetical protein
MISHGASRSSRNTPFTLSVTNSVEPYSVARSGRPVSAVISAEANHAVVALDLVHRHFVDRQLLVDSIVEARAPGVRAVEVLAPGRPAVSLLNACSASTETTTARSARRNCRNSSRNDFSVAPTPTRTVSSTGKKRKDSVGSYPPAVRVARNVAVPMAEVSDPSNGPFLGASHRRWSPAATSFDIIDRGIEPYVPNLRRSPPPERPNTYCLGTSATSTHAGKCQQALRRDAPRNWGGVRA